MATSSETSSDIRCSNIDGFRCDELEYIVFNIIYVSLKLHLLLAISCILYLFPYGMFLINIFAILLTQTTTTLNAQCISDFTGTSAACPLASGVIALALEIK